MEILQKIKKIIMIFIFVTFILQINAYSLCRYYNALANSSIFIEMEINFYSQFFLGVERIIIAEFEKILKKFEDNKLNETKIFKQKIYEIVGEIKLLYEISKNAKDNRFLKDSIKMEMNQLVDLIIEFLCSENTEVRLLGECLRDSLDKIYNENLKYKSFCEYKPRIMFSDFFLHEEVKNEDLLLSLISSMQDHIDRSQMLLQKCLIEQMILTKLQTEFSNTEKLKYNFVEKKEKAQRTAVHMEPWDIIYIYTWEITYEDKQLVKCYFEDKEIGHQFGVIMTVVDYTRHVSRKYFIKAHNGYALTDLLDNLVIKRDFFQYEASYFPSKPDVTEMFVYKMLEKLRMGPNIQFIINPYVRSGLFIVSEALPSFEVIRKIKSDEIKSFTLRERIKTLGITPFKIAIIQIFLIQDILSLSDIHDDNLGIICEIGDLEWRILDFKMLSPRKMIDLEYFFRKLLRYQKNLFEFLQKRDQTEVVKKVIENLKNKKKFNECLETTYRDVLTYLQQLSSEGKTNFELLGMNLEEEKKTLERYKNYLEDNFDFLDQNFMEEELKSKLKSLKINLRILIYPREIRFYREIDEIRIFIYAELLHSLINIFYLFDKNYFVFLVNKLCDVKSYNDKIFIITESIRKLNSLDLNDRKKLKGLFALLEIMEITPVLNIFEEGINKDNMNFESLKIIAVAV